MKKLLKNVCLTMICGSCLLVNPSFGHDDAGNGEKVPDISTYTNPIVLKKGIKDIESIRYRLEDYIKENYKGYEIKMHSYSMKNDRYIRVVTIENDAKDEKRIYFDLTDVYKKLGASKDRKIREQVKATRELHLPIDPDNPPKNSADPFA